METTNDDNESTSSEEEEEIKEDNDDISEGEMADNIHDIMASMDHELLNTTMAESFRKVSKNNGCGLDPVDVDFNLVQNLLDNYKEQLGEATPTSNILTTLGLSIDSYDN